MRQTTTYEIVNHLTRHSSDIAGPSTARIRHVDRLQLFLPPDPHSLFSRHFPFLAFSRSLLILSLCTLSLFSRSFSPFFHQTLFKFSGSSSNRTSHSFFNFFIHSFLFIRLLHYAALLAYRCPRYRLRGSTRQCSQRARNDEQG